MDGVDNCCIALILLGAVIEGVSKCFVPAYAKQKESAIDAIDDKDDKKESQNIYKPYGQKMT